MLQSCHSLLPMLICSDNHNCACTATSPVLLCAIELKPDEHIFIQHVTCTHVSFWWRMSAMHVCSNHCAQTACADMTAMQCRIRCMSCRLKSTPLNLRRRRSASTGTGAATRMQQKGLRYRASQSTYQLQYRLLQCMQFVKLLLASGCLSSCKACPVC